LATGTVIVSGGWVLNSSWVLA